jgi:hypothetical protein
VRQRLVDDAPVVETAMRVPGGDILHRAYAIRSAPADGAEELVVVEIENATPVPVALAIAVRPYNPEGLAVIERIGLHGRGGGRDDTVTVDGRVALLLPRAPNRAAGSTFREGDVATTVLGGDAGTAFPRDLRCDAGLASAAFVYPLPHRATATFLIPLVPPHRTRRRGLARRRLAAAPSSPPAVPTAAQVANGWKAHAGRGMRLVLPDTRLAAAVEANRRFLLLLHDGDEITPGPATYHRFWFRDAAYLLGALDRYGYADEVAEVLALYPGRQRSDGLFFSQSREWDANGAALHAIAEHWRLHRDRGAIEGLGPVVAAGAEWIERKRGGAAPVAAACTTGSCPPASRRSTSDRSTSSTGTTSGGCGGCSMPPRCSRRSGSPAPRATSEPAPGASGPTSRPPWRRSPPGSARRRSQPGPNRRVDPGAIGSLAACWPLRLLEADDPRISATVAEIDERFCLGPAFFQGISHTGLGTYLTLQLAFVELEVGDRRALDRLDWLLSVATPTWTWPEAVHPRLEGGCMGDGHHGWAAADLLTFVRNLLVRETLDGGLALCSLVPTHWLGQQLEVHDAPTHHGLLSFALRWHGDRPALLWELQPHDGATAVRITAPGLDPSWSTTELRGDALLAPVPPPEEPQGSAAPGPTAPDGPAHDVTPDVPATPVRLGPRRRRPD